MPLSDQKKKKSSSAQRHLRLGQTLKKARIKQNLSQKDVAGMLGYESAQVMSDWERGRAPLPMKQLSHLAELLKLDRNQLFELLLDFSVERLRQNMEEEFTDMTAKERQRSR